ncbi:Nuclear polyadenylated RNA-binding protein 3 [Spathaspora sp. JA1]|nr:Nuclear polyadenylated RNA-binding protein 3 [Spathaspora sp. JA1]
MEVTPINLHRSQDQESDNKSNTTSTTESVNEHVGQEEREEQEASESPSEAEDDSADGVEIQHEGVNEQETATENVAGDIEKEEDNDSVEVELHEDVVYEPENALSSEDSKLATQSEVPYPNREQSSKGGHTEEEDEDDYDPELAVSPQQNHVEISNVDNEASIKSPTPQPTTVEPSVKSTFLKDKSPPIGLPPKPPVIATGGHKKIKSPLPAQPPTLSGSSGQNQKLREAYDAVMHSEIAKDPNFVNLPQAEQMKLILEQLNKQGVSLTTPDTSSSSMNYDQVYSYNKPFKNLKDPIPLVPVNEYCRRPNITAPMTPEEEEAYDEFIKREMYYMNLQNWDEFPDKSRLFMGNLPANTISKQDLFRIFSQYGDVIQIAIKAGYGFVQFRTAEACLACIKGETNVPLHNKIMRLDASKPQKARRPGRPDINNPNLSSRGRERSNMEGDSPSSKRQKMDIDCIVYITGKSSVFFIRKVKKAFANSQVTIDTEDVTHRTLSDVISEAAYSGVIGACVVKESKVDVQTFESMPDGGIKFDEYADIDPEVGADLISKAKYKRYDGNPPRYYPQDVSYHDNRPHEPAPYQQQPQPYGSDPYYNEPMQGNHHDRDRRRGRRGGGAGGGRDRRDRDRRGGGRGGGGGDGGYSSNQGWDQPYGSNSPQYNQYGQPPIQAQFQPQAQPPPRPPPQEQYGYGQQPQPSSDQAGLMSALQGLNPSQVQGMISLLQQQQQQQPHQQPSYNQGGGYSGGAGGYSSSYGGGTPNSQVNALLSQLQNTQSSSPYGTNSSQRQQQQQQQGSSTQSLMETLARLARK